jgi:hypothetical protein
LAALGLASVMVQHIIHDPSLRQTPCGKARRPVRGWIVKPFKGDMVLETFWKLAR